MEALELRCDPTPNPDAMKFTVNREVSQSQRGQTFTSALEALAVPLARRLLAIDGVASVFLLHDFVTVTRAPAADWPRIVAAAEAELRSYFSAGS